MNNGEVGLVIEANAANKTRPKLLMLMGANKQFIDSSILELAVDPVDVKGEPYRIHKVLRKGEYGLDLYEFNQQGGFEKAFRGK